MEQFAIIKTGGKQYQVKEGAAFKFEKLDVAPGKKVIFEQVLLHFDGNEGVKIGAPVLEDIKVEGEVVEHAKGKKLVVFKYKPKKHERKKKGHRQPYTLVKIIKIGDSAEKSKTAEKVKPVRQATSQAKSAPRKTRLKASATA